MTAIVKSATPAAGLRLFAGPWGRRIVAATLTLVALPACSRLGSAQHDEMDWARAALERNDHLQVVASDTRARTFTVRLKDSDELRVLSLDQLVAGPPSASNQSSSSAAAPASSSTAGEAESGTGAAAASNAPAQSPPPAPGSGSQPVEDQGGKTGPDEQTAQNSTNEAATPAAPASGPHSQPAADAKAGSVLASGPGYTIKASGSQATSPRQANGQTAARGTPLEHLHDPIICQGSRLLHIDNRNLEFDGDAVTAEDGCEIHITNSHIRAKGIGVQARAASVHIENSEIDGDSGSIDASDGAQVYAEASRFKGLTRHMEASAFHDLGGNVWN